MRHTIFVVLATVLVCASAFAADNESKASVFAGYSYTRFDGGTNANGFTGEVAINATKSLSLVGNIGGAYSSIAVPGASSISESDYSFLFGPRFIAHMGKADLFGHALFGGMDARSSGVSTSAFAMGFGGGVNMAIGNGKKAWRLVEFDYLPTHFASAYQKNIRITTGLQFNF